MKLDFRDECDSCGKHVDCLVPLFVVDEGEWEGRIDAHGKRILEDIVVEVDYCIQCFLIRCGVKVYWGEKPSKTITVIVPKNL